MTANDSKSYLSYLNKLVDQYNNTYHHSINKKPINADYSDLTEKIETNSKAPKFEVNDRVRITKYKNIFRLFLEYINNIFRIFLEYLKVTLSRKILVKRNIYY